jgi:hypothetical protein
MSAAPKKGTTQNLKVMFFDNLKNTNATNIKVALC